MLNLQLLHLRPDLEEPGVEVVETARSASRVFLASDLPPVFFGTACALPFDWAGVVSPSPSVSSSTSMGKGALLLGPALANGRTILPPVEPVSHGGESEMADLLFVVSTTTAAAELPAVSVGFLCLCRPCAKLQRSLADLHRAQAAPVPYAFRERNFSNGAETTV